MEWIESLITSNFDWSFIILILLGNFYIYDLSFYPQKLLAWKKSKTFLTAVHSLLLGILYYYMLTILNSEVPPIKILLNSFLLSTSLYEFGIKDVLLYLKEHGSSFLLGALKKRMEDSGGTPKE